jgi:hypothetical protein
VSICKTTKRSVIVLFTEETVGHCSSVPELDEKQPSEQQPHAWLGRENFDELAGGGDC